MKKTTILFLILLVGALAGGLTLMKKNQSLQKGASFANTSLIVLPSEKITKGINETLSAQVWFQTESSAKVDGVQSVICYGNQLSLNADSGVEVNTDAGFDSSPIVSIKAEGTQSCATVVVTSKKAASNLQSSARAFTLNFRTVSAGTGTIAITQSKSMVTGDNLASETDKVIAITSVAGTTYEVTGAVITGEEPILNYKVAFKHVNAGDNACVVNWPIQVIVLGGGTSKVYSGVVPTSKTESDGKVVMQGTLVLSGFSKFSDVAVFFKGPKHLQMKYAIQNQSAAYTKAGGELVLTNNSSTSTVYDFTAYPMIPGDVSGGTDGVQDGWIDGIDFSYVKTRALTHETVSSGAYLKSDLDGNCQVNSNDVNVLKISLQTKQEELY